MQVDNMNTEKPTRRELDKDLVRPAPTIARLPVSEFPQDVADALRKRGWNEDDMPGIDTAFDEYCNWHGLTNWGPTLRDVLAGLQRREADSDEAAMALSLSDALGVTGLDWDGMIDLVRERSMLARVREAYGDDDICVRSVLTLGGVVRWSVDNPWKDPNIAVGATESEALQVAEDTT